MSLNVPLCILVGDFEFGTLRIISIVKVINNADNDDKNDKILLSRCRPEKLKNTNRW